MSASTPMAVLEHTILDNTKMPSQNQSRRLSGDGDACDAPAGSSISEHSPEVEAACSLSSCGYPLAVRPKSDVDGPSSAMQPI